MAAPERDTDSDWQRIAENEPYWGVLSEDRFRMANLDDAARGQFMASGEQHVSDLLGFIKHHLDPAFTPRRVLDVGCGVGRLLIPLASHAHEAVGADVSPAMLALCRQHADDAGADNLTLIPCDDELSETQGEFDLALTYLVLQHVPPERGYRLIQSMIDRVRVGGILALHLTYARTRQYLGDESPQAPFYRREGNSLVTLGDSGWRADAGTIAMYDYDLNEVLLRISRYTGHPVLTLPTEDAGHLGVNLVFAKANQAGRPAQ